MNLPQELQARVRAEVRCDAGAARALLAALVRLPTDNPPGDCAHAAAVTRGELMALGLTVEAHPVPAEAVVAAGMRSITNLIVRQRFADGGPCIALNAHGDVVPPGQGWTHDPYGAELVEEDDGGATMYGRGVAVSKSDFVTYTFALLALQRLAAQGLALRGCVELHLTWDEEAGGALGPRWLLEQGLSRPDYAICAGFSHAVTTAHNGCLHLAVSVHGRQAHAAMPQEGVDALAATTAILVRLYELREALAQRRSATPGIGHATLNVGLIAGGINTNVVPDQVEFRLDRRVIPEESMAAAEAELRTLIAATAASMPGIRVEIRRLLAAQPLAPLAGAERLSTALREAAAGVFGGEIGETGVPLYTDARHYAAAGIPTVLYGAGPRSLSEARGHAADERLRMADLEGATAVVACALAGLLV